MDYFESLCSFKNSVKCINEKIGKIDFPKIIYRFCFL